MQSNTRPWIVTLGLTGALVLLFGFQNCAPMLPLEGVATVNSNARATATPGPIASPSPGDTGYQQNIIDGVCSDNTTTDPMASNYVTAANGTLLGFVLPPSVATDPEKAAFWKVSQGNLIHGVVCSITGPNPEHKRWYLAAIGDFNGDFNADVLWRNETTNEVAVWLMNGANRTQTKILTESASSSTTIKRDASWEIEGVGLFDGTGRASLLWRNKSTREIQVWAMNGINSPASRALASGFELAPEGFKLVGIGDFDGNYRSDLLFRNEATGADTLWFMENTGALTASNFADAIPATATKILIGDYNGDTRSDLLIQAADRSLQIRYISRRGQLTTPLAIAAPVEGWTLQFAQDVTTDNVSDWIWEIPGPSEKFVAYTPLSGTPGATRTFKTLSTGWSLFTYAHY